MFVFRSRRTTLTKRLLKARKQYSNGASDGGITTLLKKLTENQLDMLWTAVEGRGHDFAAGCILLPRELESHVLCCQTWRWPDLLHANQLRRLPVCRSACDTVYICCNPYHWSRIYQQPDLPPPPYLRKLDLLKPEDRAPSEELQEFPGSLTTSGEEIYTNPLEWCKIAYWELTQRVGPLYPVEAAAVNIFGDIPIGDGLSLATLSLQRSNPSESVRNTRRKIGLGVTLSREGDHIWIYNRSDCPIFVNSLTLENAYSPVPTRVPAEQCLCVYDPVKATMLRDEFDFGRFNGPIDTNSIRLSFVKGWGRKYSRQEITSCPCWLEVLLAPIR